MFIERNPVPKFILLSLGLHFVLALLIGTYYHPEAIDRVVRVSIINGSPAAQVLRSILTESTVKSEAVLPNKFSAPKKKNVQSSPLPQTGETPRSEAQSGSTGPSEVIETVKEKYKRTLTELINSQKRYPNKALALQQEGVVTLRLVLAKNGTIKSVEVLEGSPYKSLAIASVNTIKTIHKFPALPKELKMDEYSVRIPIEYKIEQ
jgi:TonB family protein